MSNLALIQPQRADFDTTQITDWPDGLPMIATPSPGGVVAGTANVGKGSVLVAAVDAGADLSGVQVATVTAVTTGQTYLSVTDLDGTVTGRGVVGLPIYAGGVTFTVSQVAGQPALAVGDTFAIATMPAPVDLSGLRFDLDARVSAASATIALQATSDGASPTIASGGASGTIAMAVPKAVMAKVAVKPEGYPYAITATDLATGQVVPAFYGLIHHTANAAQIGQVS